MHGQKEMRKVSLQEVLGREGRVCRVMFSTGSVSQCRTVPPHVSVGKQQGIAEHEFGKANFSTQGSSTIGLGAERLNQGALVVGSELLPFDNGEVLGGSSPIVFERLGRCGMTKCQTSVERDPFCTSQMDQGEPLKRALQRRLQCERVIDVPADECNLNIGEGSIPWLTCFTDHPMFGCFPVDIPELHLEKGHVCVVGMPDPHFEPNVLPPDMVVQTTAVGRVEIEVVVLGGDLVLDGQHLVI